MFRPSPQAAKTQRVCGVVCRTKRDGELQRARRRRDVEEHRADERERQRASRARRRNEASCHAPAAEPKPPHPGLSWRTTKRNVSWFQILPCTIRAPCYLLGNTVGFFLYQVAQMEISFKNRKLKVAFEDEAVCIKTYGAAMAKKIILRMSALQAAETLAAFWPPKSGPERCHELKGGMDGIFSVDVKQPYRLLFTPLDLQLLLYGDEREKWQLIRAIEIVGIEDTHG